MPKFGNCFRGFNSRFKSSSKFHSTYNKFNRYSSAFSNPYNNTFTKTLTETYTIPQNETMNLTSAICLTATMEEGVHLVGAKAGLSLGCDEDEDDLPWLPTSQVVKNMLANG